MYVSSAERHSRRSFRIFLQFQDEIFGPVLSVTKFKTEEDAVSHANNTSYGLGAGLHSSASILAQERLLIF